MFDFTIRENINAGYKEKIDKYLKFFKEKDGFAKVIPIVISPQLKMHQGSVTSMSKYCNLQSLFKELAFWTSDLETTKLMRYVEYSKISNEDFLDTLGIQIKTANLKYVKRDQPKKREETDDEKDFIYHEKMELNEYQNAPVLSQASIEKSAGAG